MCTGSLDEALEQLGTRSDVSLALFDLAMPGMAGAASLGAVRECFPDVKIVIVSGSTSRDDILLGLHTGVHGYITKTSAVDEMRLALQYVLAGGIYVPSLLAEISPATILPLPRPSSPASEASGATGGAPVTLTPRQRDVLFHIVEGRSNKEIARALGLGPGTVKVHVAALLRVLEVANRSSAAAAGARLIESGAIGPSA